MSRALSLLFLLAALALPGLPATGAPPGIQRCVDAQGRVLYTDGDCRTSNAVAQSSSGAGPGSAVVPAAVHGCAGSPDDLLWGVRSALEARDVNRLAAFYLWTGIATRDAYALMDRLAGFSARPLMDAQLVSSRREDADGDDWAQAPSLPTAAEESLRQFPTPPAAPDAAGDHDDADADWQPWPAPDAASAPRRRAPDLVRIDQMRSDGDAGAVVTHFRVVAAAGCWWIRY